MRWKREATSRLAPEGVTTLLDDCRRDARRQTLIRSPARPVAAEAGLSHRIEYHVADLEHAAFPKGAFDMVFAHHSSITSKTWMASASPCVARCSPAASST